MNLTHVLRAFILKVICAVDPEVMIPAAVSLCKKLTVDYNGLELSRNMDFPSQKLVVGTGGSSNAPVFYIYVSLKKIIFLGVVMKFFWSRERSFRLI